MKRGFTLIELLVVIAIIGILSAIVLASLDTARNKGSTASVYSAFHQLANQANIYEASNITFGASVLQVNVSVCVGGMFSDPIVQSIQQSIVANAATGATLTCYTNAAGSKWAISVSALKTGGSWCEDDSAAFRATAATAPGTCS